MISFVCWSARFMLCLLFLHLRLRSCDDGRWCESNRQQKWLYQEQKQTVTTLLPCLTLNLLSSLHMWCWWLPLLQNSRVKLFQMLHRPEHIYSADWSCPVEDLNEESNLSAKMTELDLSRCTRLGLTYISQEQNEKGCCRLKFNCNFRATQNCKSRCCCRSGQRCIRRAVQRDSHDVCLHYGWLSHILLIIMWPRYFLWRRSRE